LSFDVLTFDVFYFRRLLLRHFVGEPNCPTTAAVLSAILFYSCPVLDGLVIAVRRGFSAVAVVYL
jgi:hypothetical protein